MENLVLAKGTAMATSKIWTYGDMSALGADVGPGVDLAYRSEVASHYGSGDERPNA
jgi:hypothetical protein